jgi:glycerol uptake facilitator-like aquaporin
MRYPGALLRPLAAEALGTAFLVTTVVGSGVMAETLTKDTALALLGNTIPTGAILVVLITILGPISGAHFNPAVSLVFALKRELLHGTLCSTSRLKSSAASREPLRLISCSPSR